MKDSFMDWLPEIAHIFRRRSIRKFTEQPASEEVLTQLCMAAMAAPSAVNSQPWEFVVVTDPDKLAGLREVLPYGKFKAPAAIVVCGSKLTARNPAGLMFWQQDCSAATENILLAAEALHLGSCWIGVYPIPGIPKSVAKVVGVPVTVTPLCVIYLGYPAEQREPRSKFNASKVHWQKYGNTREIE
jgi:nitroreductase